MIHTKSTIIVHDRFIIKGGGERLVLILAKGAAQALCYGHHRIDGFDPQELQGVALYDLHSYSSIPGWRSLKQIYAFMHRTGFLSQFYTVVYSGVLAPFAVHNHHNGPNILYCHTPPRFIYDQRQSHLAGLPAVVRPIMHAYASIFKRLYERALKRMDCIVANSATVQERIRNYWGRDSVVVNPPCDTHRFVWRGQGDYYLSTARLEPLKRVDTIVKSFLQMPDKKLVVASGGSQLQKLRTLAAGAPNISFTGWVDEETLQQLIGNCIATVYIPVQEDFGMSPVEAMSAGKPVIGVNEGGVRETVVHGETGLLVPAEPGVDCVAAAVETIEPERAASMRRACESRAAQFSEKTFLHNMQRVMQQCGGRQLQRKEDA